jgi:hypothetical protein
MIDDASIKARDNEIAKYFAASLDRLSTAAVVIGFIGPVTALLNDPGTMMPFSFLRWTLVAAVGIYWLVNAFALDWQDFPVERLQMMEWAYLIT